MRLMTGETAKQEKVVTETGESQLNNKLAGGVMEDLISKIITPPANLLMWLLFSREGAEIMPDLLLFTSVAICFCALWGYRSGKS